MSDVSYASDRDGQGASPPHSIYEHLIVTEDMPANGKTAYRCKEHPDIWDTDLKGLEISHFQPDHNNDADTSTPAGNVQ
jgi:hypothetical protein